MNITTLPRKGLKTRPYSMDMNMEDHIVTLPKKGLKTRPYNRGIEKMKKKDIEKLTKEQFTKTIEEQLNSDFNSLCEWFIDNKLSIHFGEDKTKSILFGTKWHLKNQADLDIKYGDIKIKQHNKVTYLGCILDSNLSGESMATKVLGLVNERLKFLYRNQRFLTFSLQRLLCNAMIQPHYDYACSAWYPLLSKNLLKKIQISQNKCV